MSFYLSNSMRSMSEAQYKQIGYSTSGNCWLNNEKKRKNTFSTVVGYVQCQTASLMDSSTPQNFSVYSLILQLGHETAVLKILRSEV